VTDWNSRSVNGQTLCTRCAGRPVKRVVVAKKTKKQSGVAAIVFAGITVALLGGSAYFGVPGKLTAWINGQRQEQVDRAPANVAVKEFNTIVLEANALALEKKFPQALAALHRAEEIVKKTPGVESRIDKKELDAAIAHYKAQIQTVSTDK
jgi:hypothetical protein